MSTPKILSSVVAVTMSVLVVTGHPLAAGAVFVATAAVGAGLFPTRETGRTTPSVSVDGYLSPVGPLEAAGDPEVDSAWHEDDLRTGRWVHLRPSELD
jgi:hypothetical protein